MKLNKQAGGQVNSQVAMGRFQRQVRWQVMRQVGWRVWDQVDDQVRWQVKGQVWDQVANQLRVAFKEYNES